MFWQKLSCPVDPSGGYLILYMSRPVKNGLDYFPMDVTTDEKFEIIEAKHGLIGFAIIVKLYQKIYKEGYYIKWDAEKMLIFKKQLSVELNVLEDVISDCMKYNIFDVGKFEQYGILTSSGIQGRFLAACERRKKVDLIHEFINVDINSINVDINWINVDNNSINVDIKYTKESKVKESKEKESKAVYENGAEILNQNTIPTYEEAKQHILSPTWIDTVSMQLKFDKTHFVTYTIDWLKKKDVCGGFTYRIPQLKQYLINDYQKDMKSGVVEKPYRMTR